MFRFFAASAFALLSTLTFALPAQALSCLPPTPEDSFARYHAAPELYQIWSGRWIKVNPTPEVTGYVDPMTRTAPYPVTYLFQGRMVGPHGMQGPIRRMTVKVDPQCAGPWCASYPENGEAMVGFFERKPSGQRVFSPGACGGASFARTYQNIQRLASCFRSGACI